MIKLTIEFKSIDEAIVALAKLVPPVEKKPMSNPEALGTVAELTAPVGIPGPQERKGRADKGKPRGPRKNVAASATVPPAPPVQDADVPVAPGPRQEPSAAAPKSVATVEVVPLTETATTLTAGPTPQQTIEAIYGKFGEKDAQQGIDAAMKFLSRFGVKRVRELQPEQHADFAKHGAVVLAGGEI